MDTQYHINLVKNPKGGYKRTTNDNELVKQAESMYPVASDAMLKLVNDGDYESYINSIEAYDKFVWEQSHKGDKSNIFAYKKIKISPTWTEQIWAPVFERVRIIMEKEWGTNLVLIQNMEVVESFGINGPTAFKDVDGGIGIYKTFKSGKKAVMPIVAAEDKTGNFCKTACTNVDGIVRRVRNMNSNVFALCITDNQVNVGKNVEVDHSFGSGGAIVTQRGKNKKKESYPKLNANIFKMVETLSINYLKTKTPKDFTDIAHSNTSGVLLREHIDSKGYYVPPELEKFI